jgi:Transglutaminase-like superfamily/Bacterial transglutaminase-like N-terminal region
MQIAIHHQLSIALGSGSAHAVQQLLLTPSSGPAQTVKDWSIACNGMATAVQFVDAFGNQCHLVSQTRPEGNLAIDIAGTVETLDRNGVLGRIAGEPVPALFRRITTLTKPDVAVYGAFQGTASGRIALLHALMGRVGDLYGVEPDQSDAAEPPAQAQSQSQNGQTQSQSQNGESRPVAAAADMAHAFIGAARMLGIPARFVTGYLLAEEDTPAAFHAWAEAYSEEIGWIGFDAALRLCPTDRHVRVAVGLDALSAAPVRSVPMAGEPEVLSLSVTPKVKP